MSLGLPHSMVASGQFVFHVTWFEVLLKEISSLSHCIVFLYFVAFRLPWWLRWYRICLQCRRPGFDPLVWRIPWRREWQPTPVFLPGESHGQRSLEDKRLGYSPWGRKELDMTEQVSLSFIALFT